MFDLLKETLIYVGGTLIHNAPILLFGIFVAALIKVYVDPEKFKQILLRKAGVSIPATVAFGAFTPFCACGTMAVIVSMLTTALPWGPIMAFLTSSPLMSPDGFILLSGIVSLEFAVVLAVSSVIIGFGTGYITHFVEKKTHFLEGQARFSEEKNGSEEAAAEVAASSCGCSASTDKYKLKKLIRVFFGVGLKQVLLYFSIFAAVGFLINKYVPAELIMKYLGSGNKLAVPLLALIGLPLYVSGSSSIPIFNALMAGGASNGALLAFMITGPGTSAGVLAGITTIMKKKAIALYVMYLLTFAVILGYLYDFISMLGII